MKKIQYIIKSFILDLQLNLRMILFSSLLAFIGLYFFSNIGKIISDTSLFSKMQDTYFLVSNQHLTVHEIQNKLEKYNIKLHPVSYAGMLIDDNYIEGFIYDNYIMDRINYKLYAGRKIKKSDEVMISFPLKEQFKIGDKLIVSGYNQNGQIINKEKTVCGILQNDIIYYPVGNNGTMYDLLMVNLDDELYAKEALIMEDDEYRIDNDKGFATYMAEAQHKINEKEIQEYVETFGKFNTGEELMKENSKILNYEQNQKKVFFVAGLSLSLSIFIGSIYLLNLRKKREFGIIQLTGATVNSASILLEIPMFLSVILGIILGQSLAIYFIKIKILSGIILFKYICMVAILIIILYMLSSFFVRWTWKKESIIDLIMR